MTSLDDRKKAYENKFAHDAELKFKSEARRNKKLGLWAADLLGKSGDDAQAYAKSVIMADFDEPGEEDVFRKVRADLDASVSDEEIRSQMATLMVEAVEEIENQV